MADGHLYKKIITTGADKDATHIGVYAKATGIFMKIFGASESKLLDASNNLSDLNNAITSRRVLIQELFLVSGNQTTTSDTAQAITELITSSLEANKRYYFEGWIHSACNNTGGVKYAVDVPAGASLIFYVFGNTTSAAAFSGAILNTDATLGTQALITQATSRALWISGEITLAGTAGTVQFMFASTTAGQTSTIYQTLTKIDIYKMT